MRLRRYSVAVVGKYSGRSVSTRRFFTFNSALEYKRTMAGFAYLYRWCHDRWVELIV